MRKVLVYLLVAAAIGELSGADRQSWNRIRYFGGTPHFKTASYDWNTTLTLTSNPDAVELEVAPSSFLGHMQKLTLKASQITSVITGPGAWQRVADVSGARLAAKPHGIFGLLNRNPPAFRNFDTFLAILYQGGDGKPAAILLDCQFFTNLMISRALETMTGKPAIYAK